MTSEWIDRIARRDSRDRPVLFEGQMRPAYIKDALRTAGMEHVPVILLAFQCYQGLLGLRFPGAALQTGDADFEQFHSISAAVDDSMPPMLGVLKTLDATFREIPHVGYGRKTTRYRTAKNFDVEFLTPNRGSSDHDGKAAEMPALGGASAQPLRFLDFLIYEPVRSVLLHRAGVDVVVPAPERYAVHKLILASRRRDDAAGMLKRDKDVVQAAILMEALTKISRGDDLAEAFVEAWQRGPAWREGLSRGLSYTPSAKRGSVPVDLARALKASGHEPSRFGLEAAKHVHT